MQSDSFFHSKCVDMILILLVCHLQKLKSETWRILYDLQLWNLCALRRAAKAQRLFWDCPCPQATSTILCDAEPVVRVKTINTLSSPRLQTHTQKRYFTSADERQKEIKFYLEKCDVLLANDFSFQEIGRGRDINKMLSCLCMTALGYSLLWRKRGKNETENPRSTKANKGSHCLSAGCAVVEHLAEKRSKKSEMCVSQEAYLQQTALALLPLQTGDAHQQTFVRGEDLNHLSMGCMCVCVCLQSRIAMCLSVAIRKAIQITLVSAVWPIDSLESLRRQSAGLLQYRHSESFLDAWWSPALLQYIHSESFSGAWWSPALQSTCLETQQTHRTQRSEVITPGPLLAQSQP